MKSKEIQKAIKKFDKELLKNGEIAKKELRKVADELEPAIKEARKSLLKIGKRINKTINTYKPN